MPKLKPETQLQRREHILSVAERCFAARGFHGTTTQDICREAGISAGALYTYFDSKEALIAGLCERDRAEFAERFKVIATAPDFISAINALGTAMFVDEPSHKRLFCMEMAVESTRHPRIAEVYRSVDRFVGDSFEALFRRLEAEGRIAPAYGAAEAARVFQIIGDGLFLRRAVDPDFNFESVRATLLTILERLLNPVIPATLSQSSASPQRPREVPS